jgi:hypothetical protein
VQEREQKSGNMDNLFRKVERRERNSKRRTEFKENRKKDVRN